MKLKYEVLFNKCTYKTLSFIFIFGILIFVITTRYYGYDDDETYIIEWKLTNDISCHRQSYGDSLPRLESDFSPPSKSIFMHETSCRGGLNSRQACAVESAARAHPDWHVHMFFSGPVSSYALKRSCLAKLLQYSNVRFFRIQLQEYAKGTPVQSLVERRPFEKTSWKVEHTSDVLRYLTLYKFGGVYMDSDVVVVKSFDTLASNWAARESSYAVDSGLMSLSKDALGRQVADACIQDFSKNYNPKMWGNNGPGVITRVVEKMCHSKNNTDWNKGCYGFKIYDPIVFYPVYYKQNKKYFEANGNLTTSAHTYAHHMWNALTRDYKVPKTSPYAKLAKEYCPTVYAMYGDKFGV